MFFSLNKKFIYTIALFFLFTSALFVYTFYNIYGSKMQEEQKSTFLRNQQYVGLLYENITLRKELSSILDKNDKIQISDELNNLIRDHKNLDNQQEELSLERRRTSEMVQNYNERYEALQKAIQIVILSSILIILAMLLLWLLIKRWVVAPIDRLSVVSKLVSQGNFSTRINHITPKNFIDEFDELSATFNQMLENIENGIIEIKNKEAFLQSLIDGIPDGIRVIDEDYNIIIANKEYYRQIGSKASCIGCKCYTSSQKTNVPCPKSLYTCPINEIKNKNNGKVKFVQQFASYPNRHLSINAAPLIIDNGKAKTTYVVEAIRDLSEDIRFSHQQKLSSLGFLATSVAHEMKNHLGSIRMILEAVINKYYKDISDNNETKQYLNLINSQLITCIHVPERLLKLAQFSNDDDQEINIRDNINDVMALLDYEAKRNGVSITINTPEKDIIMNGFSADFKMAILNLVQNAFKAMPRGGELVVSASVCKNGKIRIDIADNGIGISKDKINRIFEPFYSDGKNTQHKGTGLGLSIVKSIIEKFQGTISVKSEENQGTCFTIEFPKQTVRKKLSPKTSKKDIA